MKVERDDAKIGLLVFLTLALFLGFLFQRSLTALLKKEFHIQVLLANAAEVAVGTEVQLQGLGVGQVEAVQLQRHGVEYRFVADLGLRNDIVLWAGTQAQVVAKPLGGAYIDLQLPAPAARVTVLAPGALLSGSTGPGLATMLEGIDVLVRNLNGAVTEVRSAFQQKGAGVILDHPQVALALRNLQETLQSFRLLAQDGGGLVRQGGGTLKALDANLATLQKTLAPLQKLLEERSPELDRIIQSLAATLKETEGLSRELNAMMKDASPTSQEALKTLARDLKATEELLELLKAKPNRIVWGTPSPAEREAATKQVEAARKP